MDIQEFYQNYLGEQDLIRSSLFNSENFTNLDDLINYKINELNDMNSIQEVFEHLSMAEAKLLKRLASEDTHDNVHHVAYNLSKYATLIDYQYILEDKAGDGVIHSEIINSLNHGMKQSGIFPIEEMYIDDSERISARDYNRFMPIFQGPMYWLYNNLTFFELRRLMSKLNIKSLGQYKEDYLTEVVNHLRLKEYLVHAVSQLDNEAVNEIQDKLRNDDYIYDNIPRWRTALETGLLVKVHKDYLIMHKDILAGLKEIDFDNINYSKVEKDDANFNAYQVGLKLSTYEDIYRQIILPSRFNLLEVEIIICQTFGWTNEDSGYFLIDGKEVTPTNMSKSAIMADVFLESGLEYQYESNDDYIIKLQVEDVLSIDKPIPSVEDYQGPSPIEGVGGVENLKKVLKILEDKHHPDFDNTYYRARQKNYRERYPVSAVNKQLSRLFNRGNPMT